jgi:hypothetical protein
MRPAAPRDRLKSVRQPPTTEPDAGTNSHEVTDESSPDVVLVHGVEPDGEGLRVLRYRENRLEAGAVRPLQHGKPLQGELVRLRPRKNLPIVCDVDVELPAPQATTNGSTKGPAQVATDRYRENWDRIWNRGRTLPN